MLKITVVEDQHDRRMIVEGKLIAPWDAEFTSAYQAARIDLGSRALIVDLRSLTAISPEGQAILVHLMNENVKFVCGVYMREVLRQIALKPHGSTGRSASDTTESA
jgi:hypothetical protein